MCTIDPLMCWYFDHEEYWIAHPDELTVAREYIKTGNLDFLDFFHRYASFRRQLEHKNCPAK